MLQVRFATTEDAVSLAPRLREADLAEIAAASGSDPLEALKAGVAISVPPVSIVNEDDLVIAMGGAIPCDDTGVVWLLASNDIYAHKFEFLRQSKAWVELLQDRYPVLWNCVDVRNTLHTRWLAWCGFELEPWIEDYNGSGHPFIQFERKRTDV